MRKRSGLTSTTGALTRCCRVFLRRNDPGKVAARPCLRLALPGSTSPRDLSDRLPVLTLLAFKVQLLFNTCLNWVQEHASGLPRVPGGENEEDDEDDEEKWEEEIMDGVFVLSEMIKLGAYLDFSDEMGTGIVKLIRGYRFPCTFSRGSSH